MSSELNWQVDVRREQKPRRWRVWSDHLSERDAHKEHIKLTPLHGFENIRVRKMTRKARA